MKGAANPLSPQEAAQKLMRLRGTIPASESAKKAMRDEKERWADEIARFAADEKARQKRDRIPPTPQRLAKGDITNKSDRVGIVAPEVQFQTKDPLDNVRKHLTEDEIAALARLIVNMEHRRKTKAVTADYEAAMAGTFGPRHGGLPDKIRAAATVADWMLKEMHPQFQNIADALAYGVRRKVDGHPLSPREIMGLFFPHMAAEARKDGGWIVLCRAFAWKVQELESELNAHSRGETMRGANHINQITRERGAP